MGITDRVRTESIGQKRNVEFQYNSLTSPTNDRHVADSKTLVDMHDHHQHHDQHAGHGHEHSHGHEHEHDHRDHDHHHQEHDHHAHDHDHHSAGHALEHSHGHAHEHLQNAGHYNARPQPLGRQDFTTRAFTVGIGGPVGSGKTALVLGLCRLLRDKYSMCVVTNDIFTREDWEFLTRNQALPEDRMRAVETGGCPHAAIREDFAVNMQMAKQLTREHSPVDLILIESGGDNLAASFSRELADFIIYVIDVAGGDKIPRKGGPGITHSDLLVVNKTDLASAVGADLGVMDRDARVMRQDGPTVFIEAKNMKGIDKVVAQILNAYADASGKAQ